MIEYITLGMTLDTALTGYDIKKQIGGGIGLFYKASYGSLYPTLKKLTSKGYLTMTEEARGSRTKKYYKATEAGEAAFFKWLSTPLDNDSSLEGLLARVFFFDKLPHEARRQQLVDYELSQRQILRKLTEMEKQFADSEKREQLYFMLSTLYYGISLLELNIRWCKHITEQKPLTELSQ